MNTFKNIITLCSLFSIAILGIVLDGAGVRPAICMVIIAVGAFITGLLFFLTERYK